MAHGSIIDGAQAAEKIQSLERLAYDNLSWTTLFRDPSTGELWKRVHSRPEAHGSGPPRLEPITRQRALLEFDVLEDDL